MVGSIFWAMVDVWPTPDFQWSMEIIRAPLWEMLQTLALVFLLGFFISKFLPKTSLWKSLVLSASLDGPNSSENNVRESELINNLAGKRGMSVSELYPCGQVEINGTRYEARSNLGKISKGENVEVVKNSEFELVVERVDL
jgi:membrane-bound serine protease (ClpP class)